jgi:hypothetical protein
MLKLENISTGETLIGEELEFFVDDDTLIGEVYLDGDLIFQAFDTVDEDHLELEFYKEYIIDEDDEENEDEDPYGFDEWN